MPYFIKNAISWQSNIHDQTECQFMSFQNCNWKAGFWTDFSLSGSILAFSECNLDSFWQSFQLKMPDTGMLQMGFRGIPNKSETRAYLAKPKLPFYVKNPDHPQGTARNVITVTFYPVFLSISDTHL